VLNYKVHEKEKLKKSELRMMPKSEILHEGRKKENYNNCYTKKLQLKF